MAPAYLALAVSHKAFLLFVLVTVVLAFLVGTIAVATGSVDIGARRFLDEFLRRNRSFAVLLLVLTTVNTLITIRLCRCSGRSWFWIIFILVAQATLAEFFPIGNLYILYIIDKRARDVLRRNKMDVGFLGARDVRLAEHYQFLWRRTVGRTQNQPCRIGQEGTRVKVRLVGANRETGEDVDLILEAPTVGAAEEQANNLNVVVERAETVTLPVAETVLPVASWAGVDVRTLASRQKLLLGTVLISVATYPFVLKVSLSDSSVYVPVAVLWSLFCTIVLISVMRAIHLPIHAIVTWLVLVNVCGCIPIIGGIVAIICLLVINAEATRRLRSAGLRVGLMGVPSEEIQRLDS